MKPKLEEILQIFEPTTRSLMSTYPELEKHEEFMELGKSKELELCWYIGCQTSPIKKKYPNKVDCVRAALKEVYSKEYIESNKELKDMYEGKSIPSRIVNAANRFSTFEVSARLRSRILNNMILKNLERILYIDDEDWENMDPDQMKGYTATAKSALDLMPKVLENIEGGYGLIEKEVGQDERITEINEVLVSIDKVTQ
jgi:hypothetical protein